MGRAGGDCGQGLAHSRRGGGRSGGDCVPVFAGTGGAGAALLAAGTVAVYVGEGDGALGQRLGRQRRRRGRARGGEWRGRPLIPGAHLPQLSTARGLVARADLAELRGPGRLLAFVLFVPLFLVLPLRVLLFVCKAALRGSLLGWRPGRYVPLGLSLLGLASGEEEGRREGAPRQGGAQAPGGWAGPAPGGRGTERRLGWPCDCESGRVGPAESAKLLGLGGVGPVAPVNPENPLVEG